MKKILLLFAILLTTIVQAQQGFVGPLVVQKTNNVAPSTMPDVLVVASSGSKEWKKIPWSEFLAGLPGTVGLPSQTGNSGKVLTTDGATASWQSTTNPDLSGYQLVSNMQNNLNYSATKYPSVPAVNAGLATKQNTLISGTNIITINSTSLLGGGNLVVQDALVSGTNIKTVDGNSLVGSGNVSIIPSQVGNSGKVLSTNGTTTSWAVTSSTPNITPLELNTTDRTAWNNGQGNVSTNTSFGDQSLKSNTSGAGNTSYGFKGLELNSTGQGNTAIGSNSLRSAVSTYNNTAVGSRALEINATGGYNTAVGTSSLYSNTSGGANVAIGSGALNYNGIGSYNTGIGTSAMISNSTGSANTAVGYGALANGNSNNSVGIGVGAGNTIIGGNPPTSMTNSIFIGRNTKAFNSAQTNEIVIGDSAEGLGTNTTVLGNPSTTITRLRGAVRGGSFVKDGGTSSQVLMADGTTGTIPDTAPIVVDDNITAENDTNYVCVSTAVFTDPTPIKGKGYTVYAMGTVATIGGIGYGDGSLVYRYYDGAIWTSKDFGVTGLSPTGSDIGATTQPQVFTNGIISNGNVGIGTTTPTEALDVVGTVNISEVLNLAKKTFSSLPISPQPGMIAYIHDSDTLIWGDIVSGGGGNNALVLFNGTNWTVIGK